MLRVDETTVNMVDILYWEEEGRIAPLWFYDDCVVAKEECRDDLIYVSMCQSWSIYRCVFTTLPVLCWVYWIY